MIAVAFEFVHDLFNTLFPPTVILLVAAGWGRAEFRRGPAIRLLLIAIVLTLLLRCWFAVSLVPISTRYFLGLAILTLPLAAAGLGPLATALSARWRRFGRQPLSTPATRTILLALALVAFIGKALKPEKHPKLWLREIPALVAANSGGVREPVLVSEVDDLRPAYFAGTRHLKLCLDGEVIRWHKLENDWPKKRCYGGEMAEHGRGNYSGYWLELPGKQGWANLTARLRDLNRPVFLVVHREDAAFREEFTKRGLPFPFRQIREFRERKNRPPVILYQWQPDA